MFDVDFELPLFWGLTLLVWSNKGLSDCFLGYGINILMVAFWKIN